MAKKSKKAINALSCIKFGAIAFAVIGLIMTLLTFATNLDGEVAFSGLQVIFGHSEELIGKPIPVLSFSFMALLAILLPLVGSFSVLFKNKVVRLVGGLIMLAGCVLCFMMPNFVVYAGKYINTYANPALGIGAILAGIFFGLGSVCALYSAVKE